MKPHHPRRTWLFIILLCTISAILFSELSRPVQARTPVETGDKHVNPKKIEEGDIPLGDSKSFSYALNNRLTYHVYIIGPWIENDGVINRTDYDIHVYNPYSTTISEAWHTEAAALPEHLGTTINDPFFQSKYTGNYTFTILNDESESNGAQEATLMVIEHLETNKVYKDKLYIQGKTSLGKPTYFTTWAYEFNTSEQIIEIIAEVPDTLDIYEMRLFLMADPSAGVGSFLSGAPIPPTRYLYGEYNESYGENLESYGGYNLDSKGYRGNTFSSGEYKGQDMRITFNSSSTSEKLYHLVFIGEKGSGFVNFAIKTDRIPPVLTVLDQFNEAAADEKTLIHVSATDDDSGIEDIICNYTTDGWETSKQVTLRNYGNNTYEARIPSQAPGTSVIWTIEAYDNAWNTAMVNGSYKSLGSSMISCTPNPSTSAKDETVTITGQITPHNSNEKITLQYILGDITIEKTVRTDALGEFVDEFKPGAGGTWQVWAKWIEGENVFDAIYSTSFEVEKTSTQLFIQIDENEVKEGGSVVISGKITPPLGGTSIILIYTDPDGSISTIEATTNSGGTFTSSFEPNKVGIWQVKASWSGDPFHYPMESNTQTITASAKFSINLLMMGAITLLIIITVIVVIYIRRRKTTETEEDDDYI